MHKHQEPTPETYNCFEVAYAHFNMYLFDGRLPNCLITLQREKRSKGYFSYARFVNKQGELTDEIALNPSLFAVRTVKETLSTLVHEQVHLAQHHFGKVGRRSYHNAEWADWMEKIGLKPTSTGLEGGKRTGEKVTHYIIKGGAFDKACDRLLSTDFTIHWYDRYPIAPPSAALAATMLAPTGIYGQNDEQGEGMPESEEDECGTEDRIERANRMEGVVLSKVMIQTENKSNRDKYRCPSCGTQVWGKPKLQLLCGEEECKSVKFKIV